MAITVDTDYKRQEGRSRAYKAGAVKIPEGALVALNTSGFAVNAADTVNFVFAGVCRKAVDNSAGAAGDLDCIVWAEGIVEMDFSGAAVQANVGQKAFMVDNHTVALAATTTNDVLVGRIVEVISASVVRVVLAPDAQ